LGANTGVTIRVLGTRTFSGTITATNSYNIEVFGRIEGGNRSIVNEGSLIVFAGGQYAGTGTLTLTNGILDIRSGGTISRPVIVSNSSSFLNAGTSSNTITLNNSSTFKNSGTHSGTLVMNGTSSLTNSGNLNLSLLTIGSGSLGITNTSSGSIIVDQNSNLSINAPFNNAGIFRFISEDENVIISSGVTVNNTGSFSVTEDLINNGVLNSSLGTLTIGEDLTNNGNGTLNLGNTTVGENFTNNGLTTLSGSLEIGEDLKNNGSAIIRPLNTNQCNTIFVEEDFENNNTNGISGENLTGPYRAPLIVNKTPSNKGVTGGAIVDPNLECSCGSTFTNSGSFIVPSGVTQITMKAWGGGGKGGDRDKNSGRSGGGGAGAYSESTITVTPGETLYYFSGPGSVSSAAGSDSWVSRASNGSNPILLAKGGNSVANNITNGASGGLASQGVGTIRTNGGNGSNAGGDGGDGGDSPNGGEGGDGGENGNTKGEPGGFPGGGGGGGRTSSDEQTREGGNGGNGQISFSYSCENSVDPPLVGCWRYIDDGKVTGTVIIEFFEDCVWNAPQGLLEFEVLAIGGGGGGGVRSGGGGGGGGLVHTRADISTRLPLGLPASSTFDILIGEGGNGSSSRNQRGESGNTTSFDLAGDYEVISGGGGGGGSDHDSGRSGSNGSVSSFKSGTAGFINVGSRLFGGSGGGAGHGSNSPGNGNSNGKNGGGAKEHAGGGGGGAASVGSPADNGEDGGNGGAGLIISEFDYRIFSAGGGGGSRDEDEPERGYGGTNLRGGNGGYDDDGSAIQGEDGQSPGSGGGGSGHNEDAFGGRGAKGVVFVSYQTLNILPVEYLYFKADFNSILRSGELSWATAKEWENSHFEIERAVNDTRNWTKVGEITGKGYSDEAVKYTFTDLNLPAAGGNIFYRIKQVDFNDSFSYGLTRAIQVEGVKGNTSWVAYPNPSASHTSISVDILDGSVYADEPILIRISDAKGIFKSYDVSSPDEVSAVVNSYLEEVGSGIHILQLIWGNKSEQLKLIRK
jgi:hypothetical protein